MEILEVRVDRVSCFNSGLVRNLLGVLFCEIVSVECEKGWVDCDLGLYSGLSFCFLVGLFIVGVCSFIFIMLFIVFFKEMGEF